MQHLFHKYLCCSFETSITKTTHKMKTTLQGIRVVGNKYIAQPGIELLKIKKPYRLGGGILGGCLVAGDIITVIDGRIDIDTLTFSTDITLNRLSQSFFYNDKYFVKVPQS